MFYGDYHTHTVYSHGKGTVEDNVRAAVAAGLKAVAITDHGISGYPDNMNPEDFDSFMADIRASREAHPDIEVLAGVETNILGENGDIDLPESFSRELDLVVCGFHPARVPRRLRDLLRFWAPNMLPTKFIPRYKTRNTDAYIRAMEDHRISVISHPLRACRVYLRPLGEASARLGIYMELNSKSMCMSADDLRTLYDTGCEFVCSSDAHSPERVGDFSAADAYVAAGLDISRIANLGHGPVFR